MRETRFARLPERVLHILAGLRFLMFGGWVLFDAVLGRPAVAAVTVAVAPAAAAVTGCVWCAGVQECGVVGLGSKVYSGWIAVLD